MKVLSPRAHAPIDYVLVALFGLAPTIFGFGGMAATLSYVMAIAVLGMSLLTAYPLGVAKIIPFPVHGYVELAAAPLMIAAPFLFGFGETARIFFIAVGVAYGIVYLLTDYRAAERDVRQRHVGAKPGADQPRVDARPHIGNRPMI